VSGTELALGAVAVFAVLGPLYAYARARAMLCEDVADPESRGAFSVIATVDSRGRIEVADTAPLAQERAEPVGQQRRS
jgi:hypothetical protein